MDLRNETYRDFGDSCAGVYPSDEFEGLLIEHWPNGQLKFRGAFKKGFKRVGQHLSFWDNGVLQELSYWDEGYACGTIIWFRQDGSKEMEKDFGETGGKTRSWIERSFSTSGKLYRVEVWKDGNREEEWLDQESRKLFDEIGLDSIVADAVRRVYPDEAFDD